MSSKFFSSLVNFVILWFFAGVDRHWIINVLIWNQSLYNISTKLQPVGGCSAESPPSQAGGSQLLIISWATKNSAQPFMEIFLPEKKVFPPWKEGFSCLKTKFFLPENWIFLPQTLFYTPSFDSTLNPKAATVTHSINSFPQHSHHSHKEGEGILLTLSVLRDHREFSITAMKNPCCLHLQVSCFKLNGCASPLHCLGLQCYGVFLQVQYPHGQKYHN